MGMEHPHKYTPQETGLGEEDKIKNAKPLNKNAEGNGGKPNILVCKKKKSVTTEVAAVTRAEDLVSRFTEPPGVMPAARKGKSFSTNKRENR